MKHNASEANQNEMISRLKKLHTDFFDGDITEKEYEKSIRSILDGRIEEQKKESTSSNSIFLNGKWISVMAIIFVSGIIGYFMGENQKSYKNAEECVLDVTTRHQAAACYDLYPSIHD